MSWADRDEDGGGGCMAVATITAIVALLVLAGLLASRAGVWP